VFRLKKGIKFHSGATLTSKDVAFSIDRIRDEKGGSLQAPNFKDVTEVQTPDDQTVIFVTKQPLAVFLDRLENRFILSKAAADKMVTRWTSIHWYGRLQICQLSKGWKFCFTRNDDYWVARRISKSCFSESNRRCGALRPWSPASGSHQ
jgi:peptide/nickel transport system substrate-binding protein